MSLGAPQRHVTLPSLSRRLRRANATTRRHDDTTKTRILRVTSTDCSRWRRRASRGGRSEVGSITSSTAKKRLLLFDPASLLQRRPAGRRAVRNHDARPRPLPSCLTRRAVLLPAAGAVDSATAWQWLSLEEVHPGLPATTTIHCRLSVHCRDGLCDCERAASHRPGNCSRFYAHAPARVVRIPWLPASAGRLREAIHRLTTATAFRLKPEATLLIWL